jgi:peptide/nickel transport system permease protein
VARNRVFRRFLKNRSALLGGLILIFFLLISVFGPLLAPYDPFAQDLASNYQGPSRAHLLGTDDLGRDVLSRLIHGARLSLEISVASVLLGLAGGLVLGVLGGFLGGWIDAAIVGLIDILLSFPGILLAIVVVAVFGQGMGNTMIAIAIFSVPTFARIIRASVIQTKELEYIEAVRALGATRVRIMLRHVIPNSMSPIIVQATLMLGRAILIASGLSFLGLGVQPPYPEWGAMLSTARGLIRSNPVASVAPGAAITLVVLSFSLVGDGLRDALDPRLKNS